MLPQRVQRNPQPHNHNRPRPSQVRPLPRARNIPVAINDQKYGPYGLGHLQKMADDGSFKTDMLVWAKGMGAWTKAGEVPELSDLFGPPPLPSAADDNPPPLP